MEQQIAEITQGNLFVAEFYTKIRGFWDEMQAIDPTPVCICNKCTYNLTQRILKQQQEHMLIQFIMKLHDQFSSVQGKILMMRPLPNVSDAYRLFSQEEEHKNLAQFHQPSSVNSLAF